MSDFHAPPGALLQFRKGGDVLLARAIPGKAGKIAATGEDGKKVELTPDRILQVAGTVPATLSDAETKARLREVRAAAEGRIKDLELALLWEQARETPEGGSIEELIALYFGRSGSFEEKLALGFALCSDRTHFRQKGEKFVPKSEKEVNEAIERKEAERRAAERRQAFLSWIQEGLGAARASDGFQPAERRAPPESAQAEVAALVDFAARGDESEHATRARTLLKEIDAARPHGAPSHPPHADGAFDLLVRLGIFEPHENLAVRRNNLPTSYPQALVDLAAALPWYESGVDGVDGPPPSPRRRLPDGVRAVTIDDVETVDRDDAVSIEPLAGGGYRLGVHISDVAHFIAKGSPLDDEAARRGTTVYLPRTKLPMFPPVLSEGRMSLDADDRPRPVLSFWATLDADLAITGEEISESEIVVAHNLAYDAVDQAIEGGAPDEWGHARLLDEIGRKLLQRRLDMGALDLKTPEIKLIVSEQGEVTLKRIESRSPSRALVAELMILANSIAAKTCRDRSIPALYRKQGGPSEAFPTREECAGPEHYAFEVRRRLGRTELGPTPGLHFTLGLDPYLQATSPIRRYQDLFVERQLKAWLRGAPLPYSEDDAQALAGSAEAASGETASAERESNQYWLMTWLLERRGEPLDAVVLMDRDGKYLVELTESLFRTFVKTRARWEVGQRVRVKADGGFPRRGEINLSPVFEKKPVEAAPAEGEPAPGHGEPVSADAEAASAHTPEEGALDAPSPEPTKAPLEEPSSPG